MSKELNKIMCILLEKFIKKNHFLYLNLRVNQKKIMYINKISGNEEVTVSYFYNFCSYYENFYLLGYNTLESAESQLTFRVDFQWTT
jgi:hypothetical protein